AVVGASAAVGALQSISGSRPDATDSPPPPIAAEAPVPMPMPMPMPEDNAVEPPGASAEIVGEVLEGIDVPNYSYYRLGPKGAEGTWVAVPLAKLKVGDRARVGGAMKMQNFKSATLNRTFPEIYFGALVPEGTPSRGASSGTGAHEAMGADPHQGAMDGPPSVAVKPVERVTGANGKTVAEVIGQRTALNGKRVRIRATVVKSTPGVMGRTYLHLRDGSGDAAAGTNDLTATTEATPAVGDTIVIEGVVAIDRDIGSGYKFPTIVENGKVQ
ncbi:MAG: hypothetical protein ABI193_04075, partial [Minicystis sp.]